MIEPINPQDHSIGVGEERYELDERFSYEEWRMAALAEAIHQTFERDEYRASYEEGPFDKSDVPKPDPPGEIWITARLIVDGEYRRRKEVQSNA